MSLISKKDAVADWKFDNGREFPGAKGGLTVDPDARREGRDTLKLLGDFTGGGNYVQAGRKIDNIDIRELSMWARNPEAERFTLRLSDSTGQTHQIDIKTDPRPDWQHVVLPLERFFAHRGDADAVTNVAKYESWGGAKDGKWHGPATAIYILLGKTDQHKLVTLWLNDVEILPRPTAVAGAGLHVTLPLIEITDGQHDWRYVGGEEFPGAKGSLTVAKDQPAAGQSCLKLAGDFSHGGAYIAADKELKDLEVSEVTAFQMRIKSDNAATIGLRLVDDSGQTHQRKDVPIVADGSWHDFTIKPKEIAGGEHWGGANDGKWHGAPRLFSISIDLHSDSKNHTPAIYFADLRIEGLVPVFAQAAAFKSDFESPLGADWKAAAGVAIDGKVAARGSGSLALVRTLADIDRPCSVTGPTFSIVPGQWQLGLACKSDLHSPDSSYNAVVRLECFDASGKALDRITLADRFGKHDWQTIGKKVELPKGVASAHFLIELNKGDGSFWVDDLSAAYLAPAPRRDDRIVRVLFSSAALGNLLLPTDSRAIGITLEARKPLRDNQRTLTCVVRDYWGAEQTLPAPILLKGPVKQGERLIYEGSIDLAAAPLEIGRYYELHAEIPQEGAEPFRNYTSLAILPEAVTKKYKPAEIPFTSRNWDNRFSEYFKLSDRLGVRMCGIWGGWSTESPFKPDAPALDLCAKLGMGAVTGTPINEIEYHRPGYERIDDKMLRAGVRHWIDKYGKVASPLVIDLGNEPHGTGERVLENVRAYRSVYEEVKKIDPSITVLATSVEPNEEYFKAGYQNYCDVFDFHIYENPENVREAIGAYQALMKKYNCVKPIWSTELGLNSEGQTRQVVAQQVTKKFTTFFAAGGASVSWFGLLYPDPEGKSHGDSGDTHNVFDCRYNRYCPRLDAIAYYNAVNAIAVKKFVAEKAYAGGVHDFLFRDRDGQSLQVIWTDKGRQDFALPLPGVKKVQVVRIDGSRRSLDPVDGAITLSASEDPLLLLYDGGPQTLPPALGTALATIQAAPATVARQGPMTLTVALSGAAAADVALEAPPFWKVDKSQPAAGATSIVFTVTPAGATAFHQADLTVRIAGLADMRRGELYWRAPAAE